MREKRNANSRKETHPTAPTRKQIFQEKLDANWKRPPDVICWLAASPHLPKVSAQPMGPEECAKLWLGKLTKLNPNQAGPGAACRGKAPVRVVSEHHPVGQRCRVAQTLRRRSNAALPTHKRAPIVDAAHIEPWAETQNDDVTNGLALSKSAHWMFDEALWSLDDHLRIVVNTKQFKEHGPELVRLYSFAGRHLQFDPGAKLRPAVEFFKQRGGVNSKSKTINLL